MKRILMTAYLYVAALIGAGFASGQEILCFFVKYGRAGFYGAALSAIIFTTVIYLVVRECIKNYTFTYPAFLCSLVSPGTAALLRLISGIFSVAVFAAMLAAIDNMGVMLFGVPEGVLSLIASVICIYLFIRRRKMILAADGAAGIIITIGIISCALYMLCYREYHVFSRIPDSLGSAYIYSGYNLISLIPIMVISSQKLKNSHEALAVSLISGITMLIIMLLMFAILGIYANKITLGEIPMLTLAMRQNKTFSFIYALILTAAAATTLFASGEAFTEAFNLENKNTHLALIIISAYALSSAGLSELVNRGYRFFGIVSGISTAFMIFKIIKNNRLRKNNI